MEGNSDFTTTPEKSNPPGGREPEAKPNYWAVLPAAIRYDPELSASAKLLYAEISSLTGAAGYCYAANAYFERLYDLSERTVSRLIRELAARGYIRVEDGEGGKKTRKLYAGINPVYAPPDKNVGTPRQNCLPSPDKNVGENKKENKKENKPPKAPQGAEWEPEMFERFWKAYPRHEDKASARREWDRLKPDRKLMQAMSAALARAKTSDEWQRGIGIPYACRWLRNRRWEEWAGEDVSAPDTGAPPDRSLRGERW